MQKPYLAKKQNRSLSTQRAVDKIEIRGQQDKIDESKSQNGTDKIKHQKMQTMNSQAIIKDEK